MKNLLNNSNEMKTQVETFIIEETSELIYDNEKLNQWNELVNELGLEGQTKIVTKEKSPIPFMYLKKSLQNVFETLCPRKVDVEKFDISPIPVEILDLISLSKKEKYFSRIEIWYDDNNPDPVCVGITSEWYTYDYDCVPDELKKQYFKTKEIALKAIQKINPEFKGNESFGWEANQKYYLLGKWADVKHSFDDLKEMAKKRYIEQKGNEYRKQIKEAKRSLDDLETEAFEKFN